MAALAKTASVVLLSGGLDSAANLALCRLKDDPVLALTVDYGQRAAASEINAARSLCTYFNVTHQTLDLLWLGALGKSALTDLALPVPSLHSHELDQRSVTDVSAKAVWVPNRNGVLLNVAAAIAESRGAEQVVVGFNREEAVTFPDNSGEFLDRSTHALALSTANHVKIRCYTTELNKIEIVQLLTAQFPEFPFDRVWSCYYGGATPCGTCESCGRLNRALAART